ncbi:MAG: N-acetylmuramoyl-L-alanine amidase [Wenzhouxiangella sp.]
MTTLDPLPYESRLAEREPADIDLVVIHATELPDLATAREYGERIVHTGSQTGNSGHFYIDRDGSIQQWVAVNRVAHHTVGYNTRSIGIELVNLGRYPNWLDSRHQDWQEGITAEQLAALLDLLAALRAELPALQFIAGHDALDPRWVPSSDDETLQVRRKLDPGPDFPWDRVIEGSGLRRLVPAD